ncbi:hypothetical protein CY35_12G100700 [Sphagnum magellanicum]|nr:hypothetical protein CY35_12G100700 [Sphagnum magellanicum]
MMVLATLLKGPSSRDPCYALGVKQKQDWYPSLQSPFLTLNFTAKTTLLVTTFPSTERLDTVTKPIFFSLSLSLSLSLLFLIELSILILFVKSFFQSERSPSYMQR